jgi:CNT family concentrative nucleoside transporter
MVEGLGRIGFGLFGLAVLIGIAWLFSNNKKAVDWRLVLTGVTLQIGFAALVLLVPGGRERVLSSLGDGFVKVLSFVNEGSKLHLRLADGHQCRSSASSSPSRCCRRSSSSPR